MSSAGIAKHAGPVGDRALRARYFGHSIAIYYSAVTLVALWPAVTIVIVRWTPLDAVFNGSFQLSGAQSSMFLLLMVAPAAMFRIWTPGWFALVRVGTTTLVATAMFYVLITPIASPVAFGPVLLTSVLTSAAAEEVVFRWLLPTYMTSLLNRAGPGSSTQDFFIILIAQASFAVCHYWPTVTDISPLMILRITQLFVAGLVMTEIIAAAGMAAGIAMHSATNVLALGAIGLTGCILDTWAGTGSVGLAALGLTYCRISCARKRRGQVLQSRSYLCLIADGPSAASSPER